MSMSMKMSAMAIAGAAALAAGGALAAQNAPGVTATEIRIGQNMPYSGPASAYAVIGRFEANYFKMINEQGGINGRKIVLISEDDGYNPAKTLEVTRRLVEDNHVAFLFNGLGTAANTAVQPYLNERKVPQVFVATGADKWGDYENFPWTIGFQPSFRTEGQVYAKYILKARPNAKVAVLYQDDDLGKDYVRGLKDVFGSNYAKMVVKEVSYEATDPTIDSQVIALQASGADTLVMAATPRFAAQTIRKVYSLRWKPLHFLSNVSASVASVIEPVGLEKAVGIISAAYQKDPTDPAFKDDPGMKHWRDFMQSYMPDADASDINYVYGWNVSLLMVQVLKQCGNDLSRENIMRQAANLRDVELPGMLPGIKINTSPTNFHPIRQYQLMRWDGETWKRFGDVFDGAQS